MLEDGFAAIGQLHSYLFDLQIAYFLIQRQAYLNTHLHGISVLGLKFLPTSLALYSDTSLTSSMFSLANCLLSSSMAAMSASSVSVLASR